MLSIPGYDVESELHRSPRTVVLRCTRIEDGHPVVLKIINRSDPTPAETARLAREHALMAGFRHDSVLQTHGVVLDDPPFLVTEDFGAGSLHQALDLGAVPLTEFLEVAVSMAQAVAEVHRMGVVHGDVNPSNFLLNPDTGELKISDFDVATKVSSRTERALSPNELRGTLAYIAPEQTGRINRDIDYRADLYSLGATYYHLLTGHPPHEDARDPLDLVHRHIAKVPPAPSEVRSEIPEAISRIVMRLLEKNAEDRYQSAVGVAADLETCASQLRERGKIHLEELGTRDVSDTFLISQKLYGREEQVDALMRAFERARTGRSELVLVGGYAGIGKSMLVNETHRPITEARGLYTSGKFEQFKRDIPYLGFVEAFQALVRQLLAGSAEEIQGWRRRLLAELRPNAQVLVDVIGELEFILGEQPPVPVLEPAEAQNRFKLIFQRFMGVFATPEQPLVLFLDDLQWAGAPTLNLLEALLTEPDSRHILIIGAYRDNEVDSAHPLMLALAEIEKRGGFVETIHLPPLDLEQLTRLTADTLHAGPGDVAELARLVMAKTGGNPFFVRQFLTTLHEQGQIRFDHGTARWTWDLAAIVGMGITENVVDLMTGRLRDLPEPTLNALKLAACMGSRFSLEPLAELCRSAPSDVARALEPALVGGLVLEESSGADYRFLHDRVEEAAYALTDAEERGRTHLRLARQLAAHDRDHDENVFEITHHFGAATELLTDPDERLAVARLHLIAGLKAKSSTAYDAAADKLGTGVALLPEAAWSAQYELAYRLHRELAEAEYLRARFDEAERLFDLLEEKGRTDVERADIEHLRAVQYINTGRMADAIAAATRALAGLGVTIPSAADAPKATERELGDVTLNLGDRTIDQLAEAPDIQDPGTLLAITLLQDVWIAAFIAGEQALAGFATVASMNLCLREGNAPQSGFVYAMYGVIAGSVLGDFPTGAEYGRLALELAERPDAGAVRAKVALIAGALVMCWSEPLEASYGYLRDGYHAGVENGDLVYAGYNVELLVKEWTMRGDDVMEIHDACARYLPSLDRQQDTNVLNLIRSELKFLLALAGRTDEPFGLTHGGFDEQAHVKVLENPDLLIFFHWYMLLKTQLLFFQEKFQEAATWVRRATETDFPTVLLGHIQVVEFFFYAGLTMAALHDEVEGEEKQGCLESLDGYCEALQGWLDEGCHPDVIEHKHLLLRAERARIGGEVLSAMELYDRAIACARETGYTPNQAIANHFAGRFYLRAGRTKVARTYLTDARNLYERWGATAVARDLEERYADVGVRRATPAGLSPSWTSTTSDTAGGALDMLGVVRATQTISNEIQLDRLVRRVLDVVMESAGARRGRLLLDRGGTLVVEAAGDVEPPEEPESATDPIGRPLAECLHLAKSVVHYVARTQEVVLLEDAREDTRFRGDPYVLERAPKSILCIPLVHRGTLIGVVYLENDLSTAVFKRDRLEILRALAAQAAISIENANLYRTLEQRVEERTAELKKAQRQLVVQEKMASLGSLTSGIAHELKNPLNFVNSFAQTCQMALDDLVDAVREGQRVDDPDSELAQIVTDLEVAVRSIRAHGLRADNIVSSMMQHAVGSTQHMKAPADVNRLLDQAADIALHSFASAHPTVSIETERALSEELDYVRVDASGISRALVNILRNACYYAHQRSEAEGDSFVPRIRLATRNVPGGVEMRIRDNGLGIPEDQIGEVFNPFFTTKPVGEGVGLGMSLTHDIVCDQHGGRIEVDSTAGEYTEFVITLPTSDADR